MSDQIRTILKHIEAIEDSFSVVDIPTYTTNPRKQAPNVVKLWSVPRNTGALLHWITQLTKPKHIVELGTSAGYSTIWVAAAAAHYGGHIHSIDSSTMKHDMAKQNLAEAGLIETVTLVTSPIMDALRDWQTPIDLLFLDADKKNYLQFLRAAEPHFKSGTLIVGDNTQDLRASMQPFIDYILHSPNYSALDLEVDNGLIIAIFQK